MTKEGSGGTILDNDVWTDRAWSVLSGGTGSQLGGLGGERTTARRESAGPAAETSEESCTRMKRFGAFLGRSALAVRVIGHEGQILAENRSRDDHLLHPEDRQRSLRSAGPPRGRVTLARSGTAGPTPTDGGCPAKAYSDATREKIRITGRAHQ